MTVSPTDEDRGKLPTLICFSHLRWDFVLQRPQHLMMRFARERQVFFFEEYIPTEHHLPYLEFHLFEDARIVVVRPRIPQVLTGSLIEEAVSKLLDQLLKIYVAPTPPVLWFYTPMMYPIAKHIEAQAVVYDCMDELSNFRFAPPELQRYESELMKRADVVFTGGHSIYEAKRALHSNIHPFPSSVDVEHFATARHRLPQPKDQSGLSGPIFGYVGVIDERIDLSLVEALADARRDASIVMIGPVVKIEETELPRRPNIHYLGRKAYSDLPTYVSRWDVALMPFAMNDATRFISPTKTPEYVAAGKPVVSTPITDVVRQYGEIPAVIIADDPNEFVEACGKALALVRRRETWLPQVDEQLARSSWEETFLAMSSLLLAATSKQTEQQKVSSPSLGRMDATSSQRTLHYDYLIVGAGFAGSVLAERLASSGKMVFLCDRRPHIGGNAFDHYNAAGILVHKYGPHIFHTNSEEIFSYLSRFTRWRPYEHKVLASIGDKLLPMPINRTTLNHLYGVNLKDEAEAAEFLRKRVEHMKEVRSSKDVVVSPIGTDLYRTFFEVYTRKQWGLDPSALDKSVTASVPTRTSTDDRYFLDTYQAMPADGFTRMFENMLDHPNIHIDLARITGTWERGCLHKRLSSPIPSTTITIIVSDHWLTGATISTMKHWTRRGSSPSRWSLPSRGDVLHTDHGIQASDGSDPQNDQYFI